MKSRMLGCAALALFAESALNIGADTYGMIPTELGRPIIEQGEALHIARERFNATHSEMFIKLTRIVSNFGIAYYLV